MGKVNVVKVLGQAFLALLVLVAGYLFVQIVLITNPSYTYETVITYTYTDSITAQGYVLFDETLVEGSGNIGYLVEEGNRVSQGQAVAEYYSSDALRQIRTELTQTNAEIALLENSENTAGALVNNLVSQRSTAIYALLAQLDQGSYESVQDSESSFLLAQNKLQIITGDTVDFTDRINTLTAQSVTLTEELGVPEQIVSPTNGYFVSKNTAQFLMYDKTTLLAMSVADFSDSLNSNYTLDSDNLVGKVVSSYTWYFVGVCSNEDGARVSVGDSLSLAFPDSTDTIFPASVVSVEADEATGLTRVTLVCEYIGADALTLGRETAEIILETYEGLRVPSDAVRMQAQTTEDGGEEYINGVYVAYNGLAKFRKIEVLYQVDGYILVPLEGESSVSEVRMYDQVIISGTDLTDGKLL